MKCLRRVSLDQKALQIVYKLLLGGIGLASVCLVVACAPASPYGSTVNSTTSSQVNETTISSQMSQTPASSSAPSDGSWRTISESSISSVSSGGSSSSDSQSSVSVYGPYQVLAACQGSGSLDLMLQPGGTVTVHCSPDESDPSRVAGSDTSPSDGIVTLDVRPNGDVEASDILVQERV